MSVTINSQDVSLPDQSLPWYRYGWPWFLICIPLVSVILGCIMMYLALQANNSLVVDDYYKQGKAINLRIERDREASLLGLHVLVKPSQEGLIIELNQRIPKLLPEELHQQALTLQRSFKFPQSLTLKWIHITQAARDGQAVAQSIGAGRYIARWVNLPDNGKYRIHVQADQSASWRLVGPLQQFRSNKDFRINAPDVNQVFNRVMME